eukprot:NODE_2242_length_811_cov_323.259843_g1568_i0.p5 GENE.NODE_2242_length_811_cov_323.259843_g1568_i0~~NODE_2242_length_811_cov_323.259843_g1568_i0.p5  ORF type:complete len:70 (+),score=3.71 NODE_2242_length_811_cov_323.259843_g1568_i0:51-260(+)
MFGRPHGGGGSLGEQREKAGCIATQPHPSNSDQENAALAQNKRGGDAARTPAPSQREGATVARGLADTN